MDLLPLYVARTYHPSVDSSVGMPVIPVHAPAGAATHLAHAYGKAEPPGLTGRFDFVDWSPGPRQIGPLTVTAALMVHPVPNWAVRIEHEGAVLAYSGDTGATDALVELARGADLALFESAFEEVRDAAAPKDVHLTGHEAGEHATRAGAQRLVLTHLPPWNDPAVSLAACAVDLRRAGRGWPAPARRTSCETRPLGSLPWHVSTDANPTSCGRSPSPAGGSTTPRGRCSWSSAGPGCSAPRRSPRECRAGARAAAWAG